MHDVFLNEAEVNAPPKTEAEARRILLAATQECIERHGHSKVGLSRQRRPPRANPSTRLRQEGYAARIVKPLVVSIGEIPKGVYLTSFVPLGAPIAISSALELSFAQDERLHSTPGGGTAAPD